METPKEYEHEAGRGCSSSDLFSLDDVVDDWRCTFGLYEFEEMAAKIIAFLRSDTPSKHHLLALTRYSLGAYDVGVGWTKRFVIEDIDEKGHSVFAGMASLGYFNHEWFPKWCFTVSEAFIERCPRASYEARLLRDPGSGGYPTARNNFCERRALQRGPGAPAREHQ